MELRLPLEVSPGREAACRAVFGTWGFFRTMHGKTAPSCGLHSQGGVRRGVRASGSYQEGTGKTGSYGMWNRLKGVKPPEACGERSRDWSPGHAGDEGPHLSMTGESRGCPRAAAPVCGFSRGTTARSVSLSRGAGEVGSPCEWRRGARHCSRAMVGESGLETC